MISTKQLLRKGIDAAKAKQVSEACAILKQVVELEPHNEGAWLWLSEVVETDEQRIVFLESVLDSWPRRNPPKLLLEPLSNRRFLLCKSSSATAHRVEQTAKR